MAPSVSDLENLVQEFENRWGEQYVIVKQISLWIETFKAHVK